MRYKGRFITVEGCEGVGKTTQLRLLREYLASEGIDACFTREPGGTPLAEKIRGIILSPDSEGLTPYTELLLYAAARRQHTEEMIIPMLKAGKLVVCDRYSYSTLAYQGYGRGLDVNTVKTLNRFAQAGAEIDLTVFLDLPPEKGFARKGGADASDRMDSQPRDFHNRVYRGFLSVEDENFVRVPADGSKREILDRIVALPKFRQILADLRGDGR